MVQSYTRVFLLLKITFNVGDLFYTGKKVTMTFLVTWSEMLPRLLN